MMSSATYAMRSECDRTIQTHHTDTQRRRFERNSCIYSPNGYIVNIVMYRNKTHPRIAGVVAGATTTTTPTDDTRVDSYINKQPRHAKVKYVHQRSTRRRLNTHTLAHVFWAWKVYACGSCRCIARQSNYDMITCDRRAASGERRSQLYTLFARCTGFNGFHCVCVCAVWF